MKGHEGTWTLHVQLGLEESLAAHGIPVRAETCQGVAIRRSHPWTPHQVQISGEIAGFKVCPWSIGWVIKDVYAG